MSDFSDVVSKGEGVHLEYLIQIEDEHEIAKTLVSFANTEGGRVLIGIKKNGKIVGTNPNEIIGTLEDISKKQCEPSIDIESKTWKEKHYLVLEIYVKESKAKHQARDKEGEWKYYIRSGNQSLQGNKILEQVWNLEKFSRNKPFSFNELTMEMLGVIKSEQPLTLSRLYNISNLTRSEVDKNIAMLVFKKYVSMKITVEGVFYNVSDRVDI